MKKILPPVITALAACLAAWLLVHWVSGEKASNSIRKASKSGSIAEALAARNSKEKESDLAGCFLANREIQPGTLKGSWPGFRGVGQNNVAPAQDALLTSWPEDGPEILWSIGVGDGHAMPSLHNGTLYLLDYDEARKGDCLKALNADTGEERWHHLYSVKTKRNHGISRTVTACNDDFVVSIGPQCHVLCLAVESGKYQWGFSMRSRFGTKIPLWYTGQCPLIDGGNLILAPAGKDVVMCGINLKTGETTFETPQPGGLKMSHASIMLITVEGKRQYIYAALGGIIGVSADPGDLGRLLWKTDSFSASVIAPSPLVLDKGRFFMTAGYGYGGVMFQIVKNDDEWQIKELYRTTKKEFASEQQTPVFLNGLLYTVLPSDGGKNRQQLVCMTAEGEHLWSSSKEDRFGLGPYTATEDGWMFLMDDSGTVTLAKVRKTGYQRMARYELMKKKGRDAWGPMLIADGHLFLRDSTRLYCLQIAE
ncbi:MAG: PQQ-binding-like beta-propeller repeat protein [Kiritimatiellae bacterium]|jgi:outer membrane protein assembly factor BamB|nr:PQQ-binding-like beta-propeller repeat protein [Kiritimatiellia bacterium]